MTVSPSWNPIVDLQTLWSYPYARHALLAGTVVAVVAGVVGWLMVHRHQSFLGHTLSLVAYPGAALATTLGFPVALGAYCAVSAAALVAVATEERGDASTRRAAAVTGTIQALALAIGAIVSAASPTFVESTTSLLFGSFLGVTANDLLAVAAVGLVVLVVVATCARPLLLATFDPQAAHAAGLPVRLLSAIEIVVLGIVVASVSQITGSLLVFALLVMPAAAATELTVHLWHQVGFAVGIALVVVWVGIAVAFFAPRLPLGFTITSAGMAAYLLARASKWRPTRRSIARAAA